MKQYIFLRYLKSSKKMGAMIYKKWEMNETSPTIASVLLP